MPALPLLELDALETLEEEETPSYLQDLNATPDFIDEAPISEPKVSPSGPQTEPNRGRDSDSAWLIATYSRQTPKL